MQFAPQGWHDPFCLFFPCLSLKVFNVFTEPAVTYMTRLPYRKKHWWSSWLAFDSIALWRRPDAAEPSSRVQNRLKNPPRSDRAFLRLIRRKRAQPSRLNQRLKAEHFHHQVWRSAIISAFFGLSLSGVVWGALFASEQVTLGGVPYRVIHRFWHDQPARSAYFEGDRQALHDRLLELDVEESIKRYYRDRFDDGRFDDENVLDLHIHQIMYNRTGYVGEAYRVDIYGQLSPAPYAE